MGLKLLKVAAWSCYSARMPFQQNHTKPSYFCIGSGSFFWMRNLCYHFNNSATAYENHVFSTIARVPTPDCHGVMCRKARFLVCVFSLRAVNFCETGVFWRELLGFSFQWRINAC